MTGTKTYGMLVVLLAATLFAAGGREDFEWQETAPEAQGMSSHKLDEATQILSRRGTKMFLAIRNDKIVHEWYAPDFDSKRKHYTASIAKALVGGGSLMLALTETGGVRSVTYNCKRVGRLSRARAIGLLMSYTSTLGRPAYDRAFGPMSSIGGQAATQR